MWNFRCKKHVYNYDAQVFHNRQHIITNYSFFCVTFTSLLYPYSVPAKYIPYLGVIGVSTQPMLVQPDVLPWNMNARSKASLFFLYGRSKASIRWAYRVFILAKDQASPFMRWATWIQNKWKAYIILSTHTQFMFAAPLMNGSTVSGLGHQNGEIHLLALDQHIAAIHTYRSVCGYRKYLNIY